MRGGSNEQTLTLTTVLCCKGGRVSGLGTSQHLGYAALWTALGG